MRIPAPGGRTGRLIKLVLIPAATVVLAACGAQQNTNPTGDDAAPGLFGQTANGVGFPHDVVTTQGIAAAGLYLPIFLIAVVIFVLIEGLLLFMIWRFRHRPRDGEFPEQTHGNNKLELIWTGIPLFIVSVLFIGSTLVLTQVQAESDEPGVVVDVIGQQFGWTFKYQKLDEASGEYVDSGVVAYGRTAAPSTSDPAPPGAEVVLPVDVPIRFELTSMDVIHSFYVPSFFFKRDAIPGRTNEFEVTIEKPGLYGGQCAEFCGLLHSQMYFTIRAVEAAEFDSWLAEQGAATATLDTTTTEAATTATSEEDAY